MIPLKISFDRSPGVFEELNVIAAGTNIFAERALIGALIESRLRERERNKKDAVGHQMVLVKHGYSVVKSTTFPFEISGRSTEDPVHLILHCPERFCLTALGKNSLQANEPIQTLERHEIVMRLGAAGRTDRIDV